MTSDVLIDDLESSAEQDRVPNKSNGEEESSKCLLGSTLTESFHTLRLRSMNESFNTLSGNPLKEKDQKQSSKEASQECSFSLSR